MKVVLSQAAGRDVQRLATFLESSDRASALRAVNLTKTAATTLSEFADRGPRISPSGIRWLVAPFGSAVYLIDYSIDADREIITILRVRHSRERR
ncbi:type II toxin-antitoxin system RelE/ParE family toxin [Methylopila sp. 73B]|uniref:type II toxin-antitoxin system RelE/ParE family toxin n=1 Tax=Methylopila sp. 73B TaxID=1120792 RepID=UPI00037F7132|nr:type II toxin-antitoxin system RelE/ParE family toxin [Methylopila sp. 73B]